jgi:hypothetical protein
VPHDITDRSVVAELQRRGLDRLGELRLLNAHFAAWLQLHCTIDEIATPHRGTLSDCWLG